jgi:vibriolysin
MKPTRIAALLTFAALAFVACQAQDDAFVNADDSTAQDAVKVGEDIQSALTALPAAQVWNTNEAGIPTFISGELGKVDRSAGLVATNPGVGAALTMIAPTFRLSANDLVARSTEIDHLGYSHIRYAQTKNGLPVVGGDLILHINANGIVYAANGTAHDGVSLSAAAVTSQDGAARAAEVSTAGVSIKSGASRLVYLINEKGTMSLAWEVEVTGEKDGLPVRDLVYVNARNGSVIERHPLVYTAKNREVHNLNHGTSLPGPIARTEAQAPIGETDVDMNHTMLGHVYDYYLAVHARDSFDGAGAKMISSVHYSNNYVNAYWNSTQMVYGDGDGTTASSLARSLDVTGHEMTHAVTERTANLTYSGESGGLNEATSDILGNMVEKRARNEAETDNLTVWTVGDDCWTPATPGDGLRYMYDPVKDGRSLDWYPNYTSGTDVHYSSGIANLAYFLMSRGGTHPRGRSTINVTAIGTAAAEKIWYRALTTYWTASTNFAAAKTGTINAANDLYGAGSVQATAVKDAWEAVGVGVPVPPPTTTPLTNGVAVSVSGTTNQKSYYTLQVPAGQTSLVFALSGGTGDADMYVNFGTAPTTTTYQCRPYLSGNNETCSFTNPTAGTWYVSVKGFSAYSGVSLTATIP